MDIKYASEFLGERYGPGARDQRLEEFGQGRWGDGGRSLEWSESGWLALQACDVSRPEVLAQASGDELLGVGRAWKSLETWSFCGKLAVVRELIRRYPLNEDDEPGAEAGGLPDGWDPRLHHEVAAALEISVAAAGKLVNLAWTLDARLPGIGQALEGNRLDPGRAKMIVDETSVLDREDLFGRAEAIILAALDRCKTWSDLQRLVQRAVITVDPDGARRRRERAEREDARVRFWRESTGTCALRGTGLPTDQALAATANIEARAREYKAVPVRRPVDILRVMAYLDLINGVAVPQRAAWARAEDEARQAEEGRQGEAGEQAARDARMREAASRARDKFREKALGRVGHGDGTPGDPGQDDDSADGRPGGSARGGSTGGDWPDGGLPGEGLPGDNADGGSVGGDAPGDWRPDGAEGGSDPDGTGGRPPGGGGPGGGPGSWPGRDGDGPRDDWPRDDWPAGNGNPRDGHGDPGSDGHGDGLVAQDCGWPAGNGNPRDDRGDPGSDGHGDGLVPRDCGPSDNPGGAPRQDRGPAKPSFPECDAPSGIGGLAIRANLTLPAGAIPWLADRAGGRGGPGGSGSGGGGGGGPGGGGDWAAPGGDRTAGSGSGSRPCPGCGNQGSNRLPGRSFMPVRGNLTFPLLTLLDLAERPGEAHGLGALDPGLLRHLAAAGARHPASEFCVTITDEQGYAIGHGCGRAARGKAPRGKSGRAIPASPERVTFTLAAGTGPGGGFGSWMLTVPGAPAPFTVDIGLVPVDDCDHELASGGYQPGGRLRHLVQVRDGACSFPACSRHARESDFEHAVPFDAGGRTCACNAHACSRSCHRVKQSAGWAVAKPRPGWTQWTTMTGRAYLQGPWRYPA